MAGVARASDDAALRHAPAWERERPILGDPGGFCAYGAPQSVPRDSPPPEVPSRRVVVPAAPGAGPVSPAGTVVMPVAAPARQPPAPTVPMLAAVRGGGGSQTLAMGVPAPATVRSGGRVRAGRRWLWVACVAVPVLLALGVAAWLVGATAPHAPSAPRPRAPAKRR